MLFFPVQKYSRVVDRNLEGYQKLYFSFSFYLFIFFFPQQKRISFDNFFLRKLVSKSFLFFLFSLFLSFRRLIFFFVQVKTRYERARDKNTRRFRPSDRMKRFPENFRDARTPRVEGIRGGGREDGGGRGEGWSGKVLSRNKYREKQRNSGVREY